MTSAPRTATTRDVFVKAAEFERVDLVSARESCRAANAANIAHVIYLSVAQSASVMRAYVDVRMRGEALVREFVERPAVGERIIAVPDIRRTEESSLRSAQDDNVS